MPSLLAYNLLLALLLPYALLRLLWRGRRQPAYLRQVGERFGFYRGRPERPVIWLHAVSVGETRAAAPLVRRLLARYPGHQILLTHATPTGRQTGRELFGEAVLRCYLPYDFPFAVRRFLRHFRPELGLLLETEIWPNLIDRCRRAGVPLLLVNARLSERSARRYARFGALTRHALGDLAAVAAQTEADAARLTTLGAKGVGIMGNLKFDVAPPQEAVARGQALRRLFGERPVFLAASTRDGEEELVLDALARAEVPGLLAVIVPRHPERFDSVAALLQRRGVPFQRRSAERPVDPETRAVLGDSMGEMFAYYAACDLAFVGGSLLPYGGQNLIEPCAVGKPVLIGPHTFNFAEAARLALEAGAALRVADAAELAAAVTALLGDPNRLRTMAEAGLRFARAHRGASERAMALVERLGPVNAN